MRKPQQRNLNQGAQRSEFNRFTEAECNDRRRMEKRKEQKKEKKKKKKKKGKRLAVMWQIEAEDENSWICGYVGTYRLQNYNGGWTGLQEG